MRKIPLLKFQFYLCNIIICGQSCRQLVLQLHLLLLWPLQKTQELKFSKKKKNQGAEEGGVESSSHQSNGNSWSLFSVPMKNVATLTVLICPGGQDWLATFQLYLLHSLKQKTHFTKTAFTKWDAKESENSFRNVSELSKFFLFQ